MLATCKVAPLFRHTALAGNFRVLNNQIQSFQNKDQ